MYFKDLKYSFLIDTDSPINVIDEETFMKLSPRPLVKPCSHRYFGYTSNQAIEMMGQLVAELRLEETTVQAPLVIVKGQHECLLSYQTAKLLQVITINLDALGSTPIHQIKVEPSIEQDLDQLSEKFPKLFSEKIGCLTNFEVKLEIDESVRPIKQA